MLQRRAQGDFGTGQWMLQPGGVELDLRVRGIEGHRRAEDAPPRPRIARRGMCKADRMRIEAAAAQRLQQAHAASERKVIGRGDARQLMARHRITQRDPAVAHIGHIGHGATVVQMEVAPQHL